MSIDVKFEWAPGDRVFIRDINVCGWVFLCGLDRHGKCYMIDFWCDSKRCAEWCYEEELSCPKPL